MKTDIQHSADCSLWESCPFAGSKGVETINLGESTSIDLMLIVSFCRGGYYTVLLIIYILKGLESDVLLSNFIHTVVVYCARYTCRNMEKLSSPYRRTTLKNVTLPHLYSVFRVLSSMQASEVCSVCV